MSLNRFLHKKNFCGSKNLDQNGCNLEIGIPNSFMVLLPSEGGKIILIFCRMKRGIGLESKLVWN